MGEQLHRQDVRVAVDDPPEQHGAGFRRFRRALPHPRDEVGEDAGVTCEPDEQRQREPPVGGRKKGQCRDPLHSDEHDGVADQHERVAQAVRRLHELVRHAAGEVVLEEAEALAQQVAVCLPAHARLKGRRDHLALQQLVDEYEERPADEHQRAHGDEYGRVVGEEVRRRLGELQHVDQVRDKRRHRHLGDGGDEVDEQQQRRHRPDGLQVVPIEGHQPRGGLRHVFRGERIEPRLEPAEHATAPSPARLTPPAELR